MNTWIQRAQHVTSSLTFSARGEDSPFETLDESTGLLGSCAVHDAAGLAAAGGGANSPLGEVIVEGDVDEEDDVIGAVLADAATDDAELDGVADLGISGFLLFSW